MESEFLEKRKASAPAATIRPTAQLRAILADAVYAAELGADDRQRLNKPLTVRMVSGVYIGDPATRPLPPEVSRLDPLPSATVDARAAYHQTRLQYVRDALKAENYRVMVPIANRAAQALGLNVDWDSEEGAQALQACLRAYLRAREAATHRDQGQLVDTPTPPVAPEASEDSPEPPKQERPLYLRDVVPNWLAKRHPKPDAIRMTERALRMLEDSGQNFPLKDLTRVHGATLRDWLRHPDRPFAQKTALNYWTALCALLNVAPDYGQLAANPWAGMDFPVAGRKTRANFTAEELQTLFGTSLFTQGSYRRIHLVDTWDAYFMLLLGLWSGARIGELGQLEAADVKTLDGVPVLCIHAEAEGSTVKTAESVRNVPVAPELIRLGFLDFAATQKAAGQRKLFPSLHRGKLLPRDVMGEWVKFYREDLSLPPGPLNGFHKFRHTVRSALAAHHVGTETADALTGHSAKGSSGRKVYTHIHLITVLEALQRPLFPFLTLPRVYPTPSTQATA